VTKTVGAYEAKTHLPALLAQVEKGETVTITRHGRPIARLVPIEARQSVQEVIDQLKEFRKGQSLGDLTIRELIDEGRR
jgi:prevent-host-death family protein